ncbi:DUF1273 domain-containing protein [Levilactobacillus bambusae]|uniref:UPF0398 protein DCM90_01455 n=1 Tax=Levilactobacillus bambusae TaxID=2024736 RepID=A0A2V1N5B8_9LACO|nr:DUF1273 domain-containing protein [Levilactobacillus bambusae]PWG00870.1 hypothetical protein DCM90_01455 [Levilactobacillus bambusae]
MSRLWLTGYRSYELGIWGNDDKKLKVIKFALKNYLISRIEDGVDWLISGGQLGTEQWSIEVGLELKAEYPELQVAMMLPFAQFGSNWKEDKQAALATLESRVDFTDSVTNAPYQSPQQLRNYQEFMLSHTDEAALVYDLDMPGKPKYDYDAAHRFSEEHNYPVVLIDMDWLQESASEYAEQENLKRDSQF